MKNAFEKYFLSLVFILISGFALIHANSFFDGNYDFCDVQEMHITNSSNLDFQVHSSSSPDSGFEKAFIELTETEELESFSKEARKNLQLSNGSFLAVFYYVFAWEVDLDEDLATYATADPFRTNLCKRYIQFEVFRI
ncbi:hypothetical protein [Christiangramia sp. SM2212]|uniref:Uncharacterized protein n=1 Tax=Christiangramia sediminicola TaxID=3073267 RepID=A0ABU1ENB9_9FLAO|nr:hypothetical protein [Christiangramia sp. SM2212]MDR5589886.1 hypothetical protein [Christiangramia sp. SM2212]